MCFPCKTHREIEEESEKDSRRTTATGCTIDSWKACGYRKQVHRLLQLGHTGRECMGYSGWATQVAGAWATLVGPHRSCARVTSPRLCRSHACWLMCAHADHV